MSDRLLLVDLENIQSFDLGKVPPTTRIKIFVGQTQSKLPTVLERPAETRGLPCSRPSPIICNPADAFIVLLACISLQMLLF